MWLSGVRGEEGAYWRRVGGGGRIGGLGLFVGFGVVAMLGGTFRGRSLRVWGGSESVRVSGRSVCMIS